MGRSEETLYRQWIMLTKIPRYPRRIAVPELKSILEAEGYTVDVRTIQRDLNKLSVSFPLSNDSEGRKNYWFWIEHASIQDLPGMEPVTALAFEMAESYLKPVIPAATLDLLEPYFSRAKTVLSENTQSSLSSWPEKVAVIDRGVTLEKPDIKADVQQTVYQALLEEKAVAVKYRPRDEEQTKDYLINPLGIVMRAGVIYLVGTLWNYQDVRHFSLHRFAEATISDKAIKMKKDFSLVSYINNDAQFSYPLTETPIQLKALFDKNTAIHLEETPLSIDQKLSPKEDRVLLEARVLDSLELRWWLQSFGSNVEILEPLNLREEFKHMTKRLVEMYQ